MNPFKPGDLVRKVDRVPFSNGNSIVTVSKIDGSDVWFEETGTRSKYYRLDHAEAPWRLLTKKEKESIRKQYETGATIEMMLPDGRWITTKDCLWMNRYTYRVKQGEMT